MEKQSYFGIDWSRAIACICIALMHIRANSNYEITGFIYNRIIPSFSDFVYLFMAISAFVMCLGYCDKVLSGKMDWALFYKKRYIRILPFFAILVLVDVIYNFDMPSVLEGLTELTLLHGFVPQKLSVFGVGWYLGIVFIFYISFPFFCVLIQTKKRAWISLAISIVLHYISFLYFGLDRHNFLYSLCYFLEGGIIYLYRDELKSIKKWIYLIIIACLLVPYFGINTYGTILFFLVFAVLSFSISIKGGYNQIIAFVSGISMEFYLSHMVIFRVVEKLHLNTICENGCLQYVITSLLVVAGTICFSFIIKLLTVKIEKWIINQRKVL